MDVIGIDPGKTGAVAFLPEQRVEDIPTTTSSGKNEYLPRMMAEMLIGYQGDKTLVVIEKQQAWPQQGRTSIFSTGVGYGIWLGILAALKIPTEIVTPQRWQKEMLQGRRADKELSRIRAQELFPSLMHRLEFKKDEGRAEALLIAEYGRRGLVK